MFEFWLSQFPPRPHNLQCPPPCCIVSFSSLSSLSSPHCDVNTFIFWFNRFVRSFSRHMSSPIPSYLILFIRYIFLFLPSLLSFQVTGVPVGWDEDAERSLLDDSRIAPSVLSSKNGKAVHTKVNYYQKIYFYICSPSKSSFVSCNHFTPHNSQHHVSPHNTRQCPNTQH